MSNKKAVCNLFIILSIVFLYYPLSVKGYGLLTHEMIVDATWDKSILPLLKQKYPGATSEDLKEARAYVYGGTVIPDVGYYPFGDAFVTNLIHYVRSGDFIQALLDESQNLNEYAFALGVLCHYTADIYGHSLGTNRAVPLLFSNEKQKYGDDVTFEQAPISHMRTEFSFDVLQAALGNYSSQSYHDFINFKISQPVFERAFYKTYCINLKGYFNPGAISILRYAIKHTYQELTKDAWRLKKSDSAKSHPLLTRKEYAYKMGRRDYYKEFGKPKFKAIYFYAIIKILPKIGPLLVLKFKEPTPEVTELYKQSLDTVLFKFSLLLQKLYVGNINIKNMDYDTGNNTLPGEYGLADVCFYKLLSALKNNKFQHLNMALKNNILKFYTNAEVLKFPEKDSRKQEKLSKVLIQIKAVNAE